MSAQKYRKKPVVIEAMQVTDHAIAVRGVMDWIVEGGGTVLEPMLPSPERVFAIETLEGDMAAGLGDWIIKGVQGEFYPCKPDIFDATYESA